MTTRRDLICLMLLLTILALTAPAFGWEKSDHVVLGDGTLIENVKAEVNDAMVWVTFPNGRMQAYALEDVDAEASGLLSEPEKDKEKSTPVSPIPQITDAQAQGDGSSSALRITDADVKHVAPAELEEEIGAEGVDQGPFRISGITNEVEDGHITVTGTVTNVSNRVMENITVKAVALSSDGEAVGKGNARLPRRLEPTKSGVFSLTIVSDAEFAKIKAVARGTEAGRSGTQPRRPPKRTYQRPKG